MSELHQRNVCMYISFRGFRCRDSIIGLFISIYPIDSYDHEVCVTCKKGVLYTTVIKFVIDVL